MRVRTATADDAWLLAELNRDVQQLHVDALPGVYKQVDDLAPIVEDFNQRILSDPDWHTYIVEVDGQPAGYACARVTRRPEHPYHYAHEYVYLDQISVRPEYRKSGCGRALMNAVFGLAREVGVSRVALDTLAFNKDAIAFYERLGFRMYKHTMDLQLEDERQL
jgi:GNAT superfamily N-acetyltransferase